MRNARLVFITAIVAVAAAPVCGQELAGNFDQLRVLVKPGDTLTVTDGSGGRLKGRLSQLSHATLVLEQSGSTHTFLASDVDAIERTGPDSLQNGSLIGLGIGGGLGALAIAAAAGDGSTGAVVAVGALMYAGIGAGIGAGIDALIEGQRVIYARSQTTTRSFAIRPVLSRDRRGLTVSFRFN